MKRLCNLCSHVIGCRLQSQIACNDPSSSTYLGGTSVSYFDEALQQWRSDPSTIDKSWSSLFSSISDGTRPMQSADRPRFQTSQSGVALNDCARCHAMVEAFRERGHLCAALDPLGSKAINARARRMPSALCDADLSLETFGIPPHQFHSPIDVSAFFSCGEPISFAGLHERLAQIYCGSIGYEFTYIHDKSVVKFFMQHIEENNSNSPLQLSLSNAERQNILHLVSDAVLFEDLLHRKFNVKKRFGLDGAEALIAGMMSLLETASQHGVVETVVGMAHRGRLNSLVHIFGKPLEVLLKEFKGVRQDELLNPHSQADVKYHLGSRCVRTFGEHREMLVELLCNPSHLEAVNPLVQGRTRAAQHQRGGENHKVMPVEIHGDAAFSGQGVVFETMNISEVGHFHTGGTIHVIINNQIGFTADPRACRSTPHCSDLGRTFQCPVLHVNGDDPEAVHRVFSLAALFRATFQKSIIVDFVCYRRFGHNESDVPGLTQPHLYEVIEKHPNLLDRYGEQLVKEGCLSAPDLAALKKSGKSKLNQIYDSFLQNDVNYAEYQRQLQESQPRPVPPAERFISPSTGVTSDALQPVIAALSNLPDGFKPHPTLGQILQRRRDALATGKGIDWGTAEGLAFGTLLAEGTHVHVSGEDVERATFSQRHAVLHDQTSGTTFTPLHHISPQQASFVVTNSSLSEYGVLGFEAGYALHSPMALCMWEAQFGDFSNGAQIVMDQIICAGETKWNNVYGVVFSFPHGYDGMGPEHSSGRMERVLQCVSEPEVMPEGVGSDQHRLVNIEVTFPTTPAQYFHLLRRHVRRDFRKPLFVFFSKNFLREAPGVRNTSTLEELVGSTKFMPVILDEDVPASNCRRLVLCNGQIYHKLYAARSKADVKDVALVRIEQLSPFPFDELRQVLRDFDTQELVWAQEEPQNMGAFWFVDARLEHLTDGKRPLRFVGRKASSSPATGFKYVHDFEQESIFRAVLELKD